MEKFAIDVDGKRRAGRHEHRIEALGLAFEQPLGNRVAAAGHGLTQHIGAGVTSDAVGHLTQVAYNRGGLRGRGRRRRG